MSERIGRSSNAFWIFALSENILYSLVDLLECPTKYVHFIIYCDIEILSRMFSIEFSPTLCLAIHGSAEYLLLYRGVHVLFLYF